MEIIPRVEKVIKVWIPKFKLYVPHRNKEIAFAYPSFGPNTYQNVGAKILAKNLKLPNGEHTASLIYAAYCNPQVENEPEFKNIRIIIRSRWLWVYNQNLWTPEGVYVVQDSKAKGLSEKLEISKLEEMLKGGKDINDIRFSKDGKVKFASKGTYTLEEQTPESLAKNGFVIASCGKEGAEKLGEVSTKFKNKPYIWGIETKSEPIQRVSALCGKYYSYGLNFVGDGFEDGRLSLAFGVLE